MSKIEISIEQLREYKIFVGTPMYGGQCSGSYTKSCTDLAMVCAANGITVRFYYLFNESLIQRARNYIVDEFLRSDCTHLLFIDADIGFNPKDVFGLIAVHNQDPEKYNVVTGPYPKKTIAWEKVTTAVKSGKADENPFELENYTADYVFNPVNKQSSFEITSPLEVGEAGTGFMLIPRDTFTKFKENTPHLAYKPDHARTEHFDGSTMIHAYFDCVIDPKSKRYLSEDYFFCNAARSFGMKIWMCPWIQLQHIGSYVFKGSLGHIGSLGMSATADKTSNKKNYKKSVDKKRKK
jgi:hypothetical protein